jgi:hypothetical protein
VQQDRDLYDLPLFLILTGVLGVPAVKFLDARNAAASVPRMGLAASGRRFGGKRETRGN